MSNNIIALEGRTPSIADSAFIDPSARIMGAVFIGDQASIWPGAILRGDDDVVSIGNRTAVLEGCIVEAPVGHPVKVADDCLISHGAILHGCEVREGALIGIGAIVLDGAVVGRGTVVAAGSVVPPGAQLPDGKLVVGTPARVVRDVNPDERRQVAEELERVVSKGQRYKHLFATDV